ncbi:MAG: 4'-phosphopantetheinyl transferase superfamily protein [Parasporobacterium sp.]|nr:4'-phosphopantetheinyl transferase superfamily protein [Parasporobacterium sp.]
MIRTYLINRNELSEIPYTQDMLSSDRKEKIEKLKREEDKARSTCAELLLIYALKQLGETQLPLPIVQDERSKPALQNSPWQFSLSHAGDYAVCSVSDTPVGVDIEYVRVKEIPAAERILHPEEAQLLLYISNANEKKKYFYECWVAKESYLKNLGIGLIVRPRDFLVSEDRLKIRDQEFTDLKGHHSIAAQLQSAQGASAGKEAESGKDNTLEQNLSYLEHRYVHVFEPGEIRGTDWKFDAGYRAAVCSMTKDPDSVARLIHAADINQVLGL